MNILCLASIYQWLNKGGTIELNSWDHNTMFSKFSSVWPTWPHTQVVTNIVYIQCSWHQARHAKWNSCTTHWSTGQLHLWTCKTKFLKKIVWNPKIHKTSKLCTFKQIQNRVNKLLEHSNFTLKIRVWKEFQITIVQTFLIGSLHMAQSFLQVVHYNHWNLPPTSSGYPHGCNTPLNAWNSSLKKWGVAIINV